MENEILINKKIAGILSADEQVTFSKLIAENSEFKETYEKHFSMHKIVKSAEAKNLKKQLQVLDENTPSRTNRKLHLSIAAAIIVICTLSIFLFSQQVTNESLYAKNFEPFPNSYAPIIRGKTDSITMVFTFYEKNNFAKAEEIFEAILTQKPEPDLQFYYSLSLAHQEKYLKAEEVIEKAIHNNTAYLKEAHWYASLLKIKIGKEEEAIKSLTFLKQKYSSYKKDEVITLLEDIKSL